MFWNIAGLGRQGVGFWNFIKKWNFVSLSEMWVEGKGWDKLKGRPNTLLELLHCKED